MNTNTVRVIQFKSIRRKAGRGAEITQEEGSAFERGLSDETMRELSKRFSKPKTEMDYRNRAIFLLMSTTGLRAKEVVSLRFSNLMSSPKGDTLIKYRKKGGKIGYSVLSKITLKSVIDYHSKFEIKNDFFFYSHPKRHQSTRSPLSKRGLQFIVSGWNVKTLEYRNIFCHSLRHTTGRRLLEMAGSIATQKVLGHSSPNTSSRFYTQPFFDGSQFLTWD
ncbi:tyrosine-type recombinase/integrase [Leptospira stimsonii]|uniref:Site-specific integrase n=1 Tax=Leptospira stimsonii TaxID=2202203 RepID=A0ABY2N4U7_9LEPT|nr:tyrosine-type recombinase/integrase [Leptospira stimsonii]TGK12925.1 site-specific integrase [Leptospira stimsonii]TGM16912.1 site-specific integrase [Leptospira stimsonii]